MNSRFERKVAIVTGAARGIGRATCERLAREGALVAAVDREAAELEELASKLRAEGATVTGHSGDATDAEWVASTVRAVHEEFGRIDILVNTVGGSTVIPNSQRPAEELDIEEWRAVVLFNVDSCFLFCKEVVPVMKSQRSGKIVNVSSQAGRGLGQYSGAGYAAGKGGVIAFTKKLSTEVGPFGINVNGTAPGLTLSERARPNWEKKTDEQRDEALLAIPLRRVATPEDQANVICFLASPDADYLTGLTIDVTGGQ